MGSAVASHSKSAVSVRVLTLACLVSASPTPAIGHSSAPFSARTIQVTERTTVPMQRELAARRETILTAQAPGDATTPKGSITVEALDAAGRSFPANFRVLDTNWKPLSKPRTGEQKVDLPPGSYVVEPTFDPLLAQEVEVAAGKAVVVRLTAKDRIMFRLTNLDRKQVLVPLILKKSAQMRAALAAYRPNLSANRVIALPRLPLSKQESESARGIALDALPGIRSRIHKLAGSIIDLQRAQKYDPKVMARQMRDIVRTQAAFRAASRILSIVGTAQDARALAEAVSQDKSRADALRDPKIILNTEVTNFRLWEEALALAAYIENRVGSLQKSAVLGLTRSTDRTLAATAALYLHAYGFHTADTALLDYLEQPGNPQLASNVTKILLDRAAPSVLDAMRSVVRRYLEFRAVLKRGEKASSTQLYLAWQPALLYLLAYGDRDDWLLVSSLGPQIDEFVALELSALSRDPRPLIDYFLGFVVRSDARITDALVPQYVEALSSLCPMLRGVSQADAAAIRRDVEAGWMQVGIKMNISGRLAGSDKLSARTIHDLNASYCRATTLSSEIIFEQKKDFFDKIPWYPRPGFAEYLAKIHASKWQFNWQLEPYLDFLSNAAVSQALQRKRPNFGDAQDLYLAYHRIAWNAPFLRRDEYPFGAQRRAFTFRSTDPAGAVSGLLAARPELAGKDLAVRMQFDIAAFGLGTMVSAADTVFDKTTKGSGKELIGEIRLMKDGKKIELTEARSETTGELLYTASLNQPDLSGLYLHATLRLLGQEWPLTYDLFAGDYAVGLRGSDHRDVQTGEAPAN